MILSDREIKLLINQNRIGLDPIPQEEAWTSTAVDLTLAAKYRKWKPISFDPSLGQTPPVFSPGNPAFKIGKMIEEHTEEKISSASDPLVLVPLQFALCWTFERLSLPVDSRVAARVEGKSSLARMGMGVHVTAPTIHAGFGGKLGIPIQLELWNTGPLPIALVPGMRICQLIFEEVHGTPQRGYEGQFATQGPDAKK